MGQLTIDHFIALLTLTTMEVILGIDNVIFLALLVVTLPKEQRTSARRIGSALAVLCRIALLFSVTSLMRLTGPWLTIFGRSISGRGLILSIGGAFLIFKATLEIHEKMEAGIDQEKMPLLNRSRRFDLVLVQIVAMDLLFSLDSVMTAVGMAKELSVMITSVILASLVMFLASRAIGDFVGKHPSIKILALSFLILIGFTLTIEGMGGHVNKGYIYFAMAFSLAIELINMRYRKPKQQRRLHVV